MKRTTAAEVKEIMDTDLSEAQIDPYVDSAHVFVEAALSGKNLSEFTLKEIERWMTAHMIALTRERTAQSEEAGGAKIVYAGEWGKDLDATSYGQMAKMLDTTGTLTAMNQGKKPAFLRAVKS